MSHPTTMRQARSSWVSRQHLRGLWPILPAALALLLWPALTWLAFWNKATVEARYSVLADRALAAGNLAAARVACERLWRLESGQRPAHINRMAAYLEATGQARAANALRAAIVPSRATGSVLAPTQSSTSQVPIPEPDPNTLRAAELDLKQALAANAELGEILEKLPKQAAYQEMAARSIAERLTAMPNQPPADVAARLRLIEAGLALDPKNLQLLRELVVLTRLDEPKASLVRATCKDLLPRGAPAATAHLWLGLDARQRNEPVQAQDQLGLAINHSSWMPLVANNLAWLLALSTPPDHNLALAILDPLTKRFPDSPNYRETRGQVLVKMGRWRDALLDLEYALPWHENIPAAHAAMARAYAEIGKHELAAKHQRQLDLLQGK